MTQPDSISTELQDCNPETHVFNGDSEANLHLNDPMPYEGWLPSEDQIRRFCEQLRAEPAWQEQYDRRQGGQLDSDDETIAAVPDHFSFRSIKPNADLKAHRANPLRP